MNEGPWLVQLLLPLGTKSGGRPEGHLFRDVMHELTDRFGGVTSYSRAPATGLWEKQPGERERDDIVVYEVMVDALDEAWWAHYRGELERRFAQEELVIRAQPMRRL